MNLSDCVIAGIIIVFAVIGLKKGIIMSVFKLVSFFISIYVSVRFSPIIAGILEKTPFYTRLKDSIVNALLLSGKEASATSAVPVTGKAGAEAMINTLMLPEFFKKLMADKMPGPAELIDTQSIAGAVGDEIAKLLISVISLIVMFIIVRIALGFAGIILKGVTKLPLLKQGDKLGGLIFGAMQGFLAVYILCAVLLLFNASPRFEAIFKDINESLFAGYFYENNMIINWMFPKAGP